MERVKPAVAFSLAIYLSVTDLQEYKSPLSDKVLLVFSLRVSCFLISNGICDKAQIIPLDEVS